MPDKPIRPDSVPADAEWNPSENEWELGSKNDADQSIGDWRWWSPEGNLVCRASFDENGRLHGLLERWHPNGERAQWATWVHGETRGIQVWTLATEGPSDKNSHLPPNVPDDVKRMDMPYYLGEAQPHHFTLYYTSGLTNEVPTDETGRSLDLADHLGRVAPDSTLLLVEEHVATVEGDELTWPENPNVRWIYRGPHEDGFEVRLVEGHGDNLDFVVSADEMSRAFTLSATHYIFWRESQKPATVDDNAIWSHPEKMWTHGETNEAGTRVGEWKWWSEDGTLRKVSNYNKHGAFEGDFRHFHPDGTLATEGQFDNGNKVGVWTSHRSRNPTDVHFAGEESVWRIEHDHFADAYRYFDEDGTETNSRGVALSEAYDDEFWRDKSPATFLENGFGDFLEKWTDTDSDASLRDYAETFEETWGFAPPAHLASLAEAMRRHNRVMLYEWRTDLYPDIAPDIEEIETDNLFERLVMFGQRGYLDTSLHEAFSGLALVGTLGNGDSYMVSVLESQLYDDTDDGQLYFFSHDDMAVDSPFTTTLSHLAYASCLAEAWRDFEAVSDEGFREAWSKLDGAIAPSWHWTNIMDAGASEDFQTLQPEHQTSRYHFWCSYWIIQLLRALDKVDDVEVDGRFWLTYDNPPEELVEKAVSKPAIGLNLLWRAFFFDDEGFLSPMLEACRASKSRLMRDAGALIERFRAGDRRLGGIEDIYEVRDAFIALDLHPDRAAEREAEAAEAERLAAERAEAAKARVAELAAAGEDLEEVFWSSWDNPEFQEAIVAYWRESPEFATFWEALADSNKNAGGFGTYEIEDARQWIADHPDGRITGLFAAGMRDRSLVGYRELLPRLDWSRGFDPVIELLFTPEEFSHIHMAVTKTLGKHEVEAGVEGIIAALRSAFANDRFGMSKDFQAAAFLALGQIGDEEATDFLRKTVAHGAMPIGLLAPGLAALGTGEFVDNVVATLEEDCSPPVLWALAEMAPHATETSRTNALKALESFEDQKVLPMMLIKHAIVAFGGDFGDLRRWVRSALAPETNPYGADTGAEQCVWALRVAAEHDELEPEIILGWVDHDIPIVAEAAQAAADKRGLEYQVRRIDRWNVEELYDEAGIDGLHDALADPTLIHMHAVATKLAEVGNDQTPALVAERIATFIEGWRPVSSGGDTPRLLAGMFRVLRQLEDNEALVRAALACFEHGHTKIIDPVLRDTLPQDERLRDHMEAAAGTLGGWKQSSAQAWLDG